MPAAKAEKVPLCAAVVTASQKGAAGVGEELAIK
jgi:hypothetical protein